jgi:hypothetical protein
VADSQPRAIELQREDGSTMMHLRCPYCGELDSITEVGRATRWNKVDEVWKIGSDIHIHWSTDDVEFEHAEFRCAECDAVVALTQEMYHSSDDAPQPRKIDPVELTRPKP